VSSAAARLARVVDQVLAVGGGGDEGGGRCVVDGPGQAVGRPVQAGDGVIDEQGLVPADQRPLVAQVGGRLDPPSV